MEQYEEIATLPQIEDMIGRDFATVDDALDFLEFHMANNYDIMDFPVHHRFTPGAYTREIHMPSGSLLTSKIHKTEHQYIISKGQAAVFTEGKGWDLVEAPYHGITKPGTRRLLYIFSDCIWTTMHVTDKTTVEEIEEEIIKKHENKLLK